MFWVAIAEKHGPLLVRMSSWQSGMEMIEFHSKSLDRTFDSIIFSEGMISQGGTATDDCKASQKDLWQQWRQAIQHRRI